MSFPTASPDVTSLYRSIAHYITSVEDDASTPTGCSSNLDKYCSLAFCRLRDLKEAIFDNLFHYNLSLLHSLAGLTSWSVLDDVVAFTEMWFFVARQNNASV